MNAKLSHSHFLSRQPILDRAQNLVGFELEARPAQLGALGNETGASSLLRRAFSELGVDSMLGRHKGTLHLTPDLLMGDTIECLPKDRVMLSLSTGGGVSAEVVERCHTLKAQGYVFALEIDATPGSRFDQLLPVAQLLKLHVEGMDSQTLQAAVRRLRPLGCRLLASGVDEPALAHACLDSGFDYLQGHYFSRVRPAHEGKLDHGQMALMRLLELLLSDADLEVIVDALKHYPDLSLNLLRLANAAGVGAQAPSHTITQAVTVMGRNALQRWLLILMFASHGSAGGEYPSPLLIQVATRGKLMELLSRETMHANQMQQDRAFMCGMLSLLGVQFGIAIEALLQLLPPDEELRAALLERAGSLGITLFLVESLEQPNFQDIQMGLGGIEMVRPERLMVLQVAAMHWANSLDTASAREGML